MAASTFVEFEIGVRSRSRRLSWRLGIERGLSLLQSGAHEPRELSGVAGPCDMHVERRRMGAQQMVVQGSHLKALGKQLAHHRIDFAFREDEVAHHHGLVPHRLEGHPAAEGEARFEGHSIKRNVEVAAGQPIAMDVARDGSRPGQDRVDNEPVRLRRLRRHGQGDAKRDRGERKKAVHVGSFRVDRPRRIHAGFPGLLVGQLCVSSLASRTQR